jgi:hypothetical protein
MAVPADIYLKITFSDTFRHSKAIIWWFDYIQDTVAGSASC